MIKSVASGRPREARIDAAVRDAIHELLAREGYAGTTIERVAAHAGVGRGAVYRRWHSKAEMVFAAIVHTAELPPPVDSGALEGDLVALAERIADLTGTDQARAALAGLAAELADDSELAGVLEDRLFAAERRYVALILERACARGELGRGADPELVRRLLVGPIALTPLFAPTAQPRARDVARLVASGLRTTHPPEVSA
ncbi:MAG TPA: TetR/AcrR family transcriptional regulator [Solirubrobacterales bacterium]|jgi:AcrR family transcriptional regulator|nr:TetR/AcrR family transcriptional regulator [Solirubrobacterales bacterium]